MAFKAWNCQLLRAIRRKHVLGVKVQYRMLLTSCFLATTVYCVLKVSMNSYSLRVTPVETDPD